MALLWLLIIWTFAAFGEEISYRGYLTLRAADVGGRATVAFWLATLLMSVLFGYGHYYKGPAGILDSSVAGFVLGSAYLLTGRNLWARLPWPELDIAICDIGRLKGAVRRRSRGRRPLLQRKALAIAHEISRGKKILRKKYFCLLPRRANAVASQHAPPSSSGRSRGNFHYHNRSRGAASECQPNPFSLRLSSGSRIAGEEATRKEKRLVDIWIEGFAGQSDRDPYEQRAGCRSRQNEEAKKKSFRHGNTDRGYRVTARDRHEGGRDSRAGRRSGSGVGQYLKSCLSLPEIALVR